MMQAFTKEWFEKAGPRGTKQHPFKRAGAAALDAMLGPTSVCDVGCGRGDWFEHWAFYRPHLRLLGLDCAAHVCRQLAHPAVAPLIKGLDLRYSWCEHWAHFGTFSLVLCVEVAGHLDACGADNIAEGLCHMSERTIFFSSAGPRQAGDPDQVNCRPRDWWIGKFCRRGFHAREDLKAEWLQLLEDDQFWADFPPDTSADYGANIKRNAVILQRREE